MGKKKVSVIAVAILTCIVCVSMIAGATFALFTDNDKVDVSVTTAKLDVSAEITDVGKSSNGTDANDQLFAEYDAEEKLLTVDNMLPGDVVTFKVTITSAATVDVKYRVNFGCTDQDSALFDQLLLGVKDAVEADYQYYVSSTSAWDEIGYNADSAQMVKTKYVAIELPAFVSAKALENQTCHIEFAVEAVQANASGAQYETAEKSVKAYRVKDTDLTDNVIGDDIIGLLQDEGDCIVLDGTSVHDWTIDTDLTKKFDVRGCDVDTLTVDAPNASINYYVNNTQIVNVDRAAFQSFHVYGSVAQLLTVKEGRAVVEKGAQVTSAVIAPVADAEAVIVANENIAILGVEGEGKASVEVAEAVTVEKIEVSNTNGESNVVNNGAIGSIETAEGATLVQKVSTSDEFTKAIALGGEIVLANEIELTKSISIKKDVSIDLNENTLTVQTTSGTAITVNKDVELTVLNGRLSAVVESSSSSANAISISGSLVMNGVIYDANLVSKRTSNSSQSLNVLSVGNYNGDSRMTLTNCSVSGNITKKEGVEVTCPLSVIGIYASYNTALTIDGGSIVGNTAVYTGNATPNLTFANVELEYTDIGMNLKQGGNLILKSGVVFSGALEKPAIITRLDRTVVDESESGYDWTLDKEIADCSGYDPIIVQYTYNGVIKQVYDYSRRPQHTPNDTPVYNEDWSCYKFYCDVCGQHIWEMDVQAGTSEKYYYPVTDFQSLKNAALNATAYIKLENDITVDSMYFGTLLENCVLDLNGHTITVNKTVWLDLSGKNITIKNGNIAAITGNSYALRISDSSSVATLEGLKLEGGINVIDAKVTIDNCTANANETQYYAIYASGSTANVTVNGGSYECGSLGNVVYAENGAVMTINNGEFVGLIGGTGVTVNGGTFTTHVSTVAELTNALAVSLPNYTIVMDEDVTVTGNISLTDVKLAINLNKHTLNLNTYSIEVGKGADLTVSDGKIAQQKNSAFYARAESRLTVDGVDIAVTNPLKGKGVSAIVITNATSVDSTLKTIVNVNNSKLDGSRGFGISTNATPGTYNDIELNVTKSEISAQTALFLVVPGAFNFTECTLTGHDLVGVLVRGGNATFTDSTISTNIAVDLETAKMSNGQTFVQNGIDTVYKFVSQFSTGYYYKNWGSGNNVPWAALVVGNRSDSDYRYPVSCTLVNTTVSCVATVEGSTDHADVDLFADIYVFATEQVVTLNADENSKGEHARHAGKVGVDGGIVFGGAINGGSIVYNKETVNEFAADDWILTESVSA